MICYKQSAVGSHCFEYSSGSGWTSAAVPVPDLYMHYAAFHPAWGMVAQEVTNKRKFWAIGMHRKPLI